MAKFDLMLNKEFALYLYFQKDEVDVHFPILSTKYGQNIWVL